MQDEPHYTWTQVKHYKVDDIAGEVTAHLFVIPTMETRASANLYHEIDAWIGENNIDIFKIDVYFNKLGSDVLVMIYDEAIAVLFKLRWV